MKRYIALLATLLGCADDHVAPPPAKILPTYTVHEKTVESVISCPAVGRSLLLIDRRWVRVKTHADWSSAAAQKAVIVQQSDGQSFLTIDGITGPIEGDDGEPIRISDE